VKRGIPVGEKALTRCESASNLFVEAAMAIDLKKSTGGYMSVDAAEAVDRNKDVIEKLREAFQAAASGSASKQRAAVPPASKK
jgi:hypothetical protein